MKKKYLFIFLFVMILLTSICFSNIIYAFICHSEKIDKHTLSVMFQGTVKPINECILKADDKSYIIPLPKFAGKLNEDEYLIPTSSFEDYKAMLYEGGWKSFEQFGSQIIIKKDLESTSDTVNISIRPFTGAYLILKYTFIN